MMDEIERLQAEAAALRKALGKIKRGQKNVSPNRSYGGTKWVRLTKAEMQGIAHDALSATDAGRLFLERLRRMEAERDDLQARLLALAEMSRVIE